MRYVTSVGLCLLLSVQLVLAQGTNDSFTVGVVVPDNTAPSTPTMLTADAISDSRIDVTWSVAVDDYFLAGYVLSRDGQPIATTTLTNYSDTGLSGSTTYSYTVRAFDHFYNYSSTSNSLSATTTGEPPPPPVEVQENGESTAARVVLRNLTVETEETTAKLMVETAFPARIEVRWGRSETFELGYVVNSAFRRSHDVYVADLEPGTTYRYEVVGYTPIGIETILRTGTFTTKAVSEEQDVLNVSSFIAAAMGDDVRLTWQLPDLPDIAQVRVVRSYLGFPDHPQAGRVIYQGLDEMAIDLGILREHSPVYYTAFVYDSSGNVSSGAVTMAFRDPSGFGPGYVDPGVTQPTRTPGGVYIDDSVIQATSSIVAEHVTPDMRLPELADIKLIQQGVWQQFGDTDLQLLKNEPFVVSIARHAVSNNLKSIVVSVVHPGETVPSSYLLRLNDTGDAYEAVVSPVSVEKAQLRVAVFDYQAYVVGVYQTPVSFIMSRQVGWQNTPSSSLYDFLFSGPFIWVLPALLGLIFLFVLLMIFRRDRGEDNR